MIYSAKPPKQSLVEIDAKTPVAFFNSEDAVGRTHRGLDVHSLDVLPALLQLRGKEVERGHDILGYLIGWHPDVADGPVEADGLLELDLDGRLALKNLLLQVLIGSERQGRAAGLREPWASMDSDLADERLGCEEDIV